MSMQSVLPVIKSQRSIVPYENFMKSAKEQIDAATLPIPLGQDQEGKAVIGDLRKLGHILIGGATGSGKSVFYNTTICSLLTKFSSSDLRFLLLDLKRVELMPYKDLPYLMTGKTVYEYEDCLKMLVAATEEKGIRLRHFEACGLDSIEKYNEKRTYKLPYYIVIIDTFSDLCAAPYRTRFEKSVNDLTNDSIRVGIHLIMCDSRVGEIFSEEIRKCFPTKIAFRVVDGTGSRCILGEPGAEELLGHGDMLLQQAGIPRVKRIQAPFITTKDVDAIIAAAQRS